MYKLIKNWYTQEVSSVQRLSDNASIPFSSDNTDYQAFLLWCEQGNTPEPAENN